MVVSWLVAYLSVLARVQTDLAGTAIGQLGRKAEIRILEKKKGGSWMEL